MKKIFFLLSFIGVLNAGVYTNDLIKCVVQKTTKTEFSLLKKWIFFAFSSDKELKSYVNISEKDKLLVNQLMGKYITDILTSRCKKEFETAYKYEGKYAISKTFRYLGEIAGGSVMNSYEVQNYIKEFAQYIDANKFEKILKEVK